MPFPTGSQAEGFAVTPTILLVDRGAAQRFMQRSGVP